MNRRRERGSAILITMVIVIVLLGGGAVLLGMQLSSTRSTDLSRTDTLATHCAEAGLAAGRALVMNNYNLWAANLCNPPAPKGTGTCVVGTPGARSTGGGATAASEPDFLLDPAFGTPVPGPGVDHDLDNSPSLKQDFILSLVDNEDEFDSANNYGLDNDLHVYLVSTCIKFPGMTRQVAELLKFTPPGNTGCAQSGGCSGLGFFDPNL
jgi:hypothetical protein